MSESFSVAEHSIPQLTTQRIEECRDGIRVTSPLRSSVVCAKNRTKEWVRDRQFLKRNGENTGTHFALRCSLSKKTFALFVCKDDSSAWGRILPKLCFDTCNRKQSFRKIPSQAEPGTEQKQHDFANAVQLSMQFQFIASPD
jgi:hypothetical protein